MHPKVLRKLFILLFVSAVILQSGFVSVVTVIRIKHHRSVVKAKMKSELAGGLHNSQLETFTEEELLGASWVHSKEFFLGNGKYDVIRTEQGEKGKIYFCINDSKEIELYKSLDKQGEQKNILEDVIRKYAFSGLRETFSFKSASSEIFHLDFYSAKETEVYPSSLFRPPCLS